jgi:hypothetical protein
MSAGMAWVLAGVVLVVGVVIGGSWGVIVEWWYDLTAALADITARILMAVGAGAVLWLALTFGVPLLR